MPKSYHCAHNSNAWAWEKTSAPTPSASTSHILWVIPHTSPTPVPLKTDSWAWSYLRHSYAPRTANGKFATYTQMSCLPPQYSLIIQHHHSFLDAWILQTTWIPLTHLFCVSFSPKTSPRFHLLHLYILHLLCWMAQSSQQFCTFLYGYSHHHHWLSRPKSWGTDHSCHLYHPIR